jgi:hypothetical protein
MQACAMIGGAEHRTWRNVFSGFDRKHAARIVNDRVLVIGKGRPVRIVSVSYSVNAEVLDQVPVPPWNLSRKKARRADSHSDREQRWPFPLWRLRSGPSLCFWSAPRITQSKSFGFISRKARAYH